MCECGGGAEKVKRSSMQKPVTDKRKPKPKEGDGQQQRELSDKPKTGDLKK